MQATFRICVAFTLIFSGRCFFGEGDASCLRRGHYTDPNDTAFQAPEPPSVRVSSQTTEENGKTSSIRFRSIYGHNVAVGRNVCVLDDGSILLFGKESPISEEELAKMESMGQYGFRFNWRWLLMDPYVSDLQQGLHWIENRDNASAVVAIPAFTRHIHHFSEAVLPLFHAALHPSTFPDFMRISHFIMPTVLKSKELAWNIDFLDLVLHAVADIQQQQRSGRGGDDDDEVHYAVVQNRIFAEDFQTLRRQLREKSRQAKMEIEEDPETDYRESRYDGHKDPGELNVGLCFDRVLLLGMATSEFGMFGDPWEAEVFRNFSYRFFGFDDKTLSNDRTKKGRHGAGPNDRLRTFLLERSAVGTRRMMNQEAVRRMLLRTALVDLDFTSGVPDIDRRYENLPMPRTFDEGGIALPVHRGESMNGRQATRITTMTLREVVGWMRETDILVGLHGSGLINGLFMRRGSVVIDILCPGFSETTFTSTIYSAGSHYLFLPNTNRSSAQSYSGWPVPEECWPPTAEVPGDAATYACLPIRNCDLEVDVAALDGLIRQASIIIRQFKRRFQRDVSITSGLWQRGRLPSGNIEPLASALPAN